MKNILVALLLFIGFSSFGQGSKFRPSRIGWPSDTTKFGVLLMDTTTNVGEWFNLNPTDFIVESGELGLRSQTDSVFVIGDSLCAITNGDTLCVYQDSVYITNDSFCIIQMGDTTCVTYSGGVGETTIYNGNGSIPSSTDRYIDVPQNSSIFFRKSNGGGNPFSYARFSNASSANYIWDLEGWTVSQTSPIIRMANGNTSGNIIQHYNGADTGEDYCTGVDKSANCFIISEGPDLGAGTGSAMMRFHATGDSIVTMKDFKLRAGIRDKDGDLGTAGQVLTSTGTQVNWASATLDSLPISSLKSAASANTKNHANYAQEWQWNSIAGGTGLKLSSTSTAAIGSTQKLFEVALSGANATASQSTYAAYLSNSHTGSGHKNYGLYSTITGGSTSSAAIYGNVSSSTGNGVVGNALSGYGVYGASSGNSGVYGYSANTSVNRHALHGEKNTSNNANPEHILGLYAQTSGTATTGFGASIEFYAENASGGSAVFSNEIETEWTDATAGSVDSRMTISGAENSTQTDIIYFEGDKRTRFNGRAQMTQGIDVASVAGAITLGSDGNVFEITGTNAITLISNVAWQNGSEITLLFTSTASLTDGVANSGTDIGMELSGNTNFTGSADDLIRLVLCEIGSVQRWREVSRSIN